MSHAAPSPCARSRAASRPGGGGRLSTLLLALGLGVALPAAPSAPATSASFPAPGDRLSVAGPGLAPALPPSAVPGTAHDLDARRRDGRGPADGDGPGRLASAPGHGEVGPPRRHGPRAPASGGRVRALPVGFVPDRSLAPPFPA